MSNNNTILKLQKQLKISLEITKFVHNSEEDMRHKSNVAHTKMQIIIKADVYKRQILLSTFTFKTVVQHFAFTKIHIWCLVTIAILCVVSLNSN